MTAIDLQLEQHFKRVADRPRGKLEETNTFFDRDIFWYNKDAVGRQAAQHLINNERVTYDDHRRAIETAILMMGKDTKHSIAMCILTNRAFTNYRANAFKGEGSFTADYSFIIKKIAMLVNHDGLRTFRTSYLSKLKEFTEPTLVQINHIAGIVTTVKVPSNKFTLNEWAKRYNTDAVESTTYAVAGLAMGA